MIGQFFTPIAWAKWLIERWHVFDAWLAGARICDPTAGQGAFALAMFEIAKERGVALTSSLLSRLKLIDIDAASLLAFKETARANFGVNFPIANLLNHDVLTTQFIERFDILIGNPPWMTYAKLPLVYKRQIASLFINEGLVLDKRRLLLGSSRIDLSALILNRTLGRLLEQNGSGYFYIPLSLFFGDDAHSGFRNYISNGRDFKVEEVYEFSKNKVFKGVSTAYGAAHFHIDSRQEFPVKYFKEIDNEWIPYSSIPLHGQGSQWRITTGEGRLPTFNVSLSADQKPRQGVNTCGANEVLLFREKPAYLPSEFLFPVATKESWRGSKRSPMKWILLPYDRVTAKPLSWGQITKSENLAEYLMQKKSILEARKGTLIQSAIQNDKWWSLLGVGTYSFAPYKVIWEAYGRDQFTPIILDNFDSHPWQGNQALHAYIPCWSKAEAQRIQAELSQPAIPVLLRELNGGGKCNWAQPGKVMKIIAAASATDKSLPLFGLPASAASGEAPGIRLGAGSSTPP